ncbi:zf-HC2 domain-containing protein [bacterium]|nr:zf-HC2 domain-containing protein [bacterium]
MRCEKVKRELSTFIDGEVSPKLKKEIEEHFNQCTDCFREYQEFKLMIQETANTPRVTPPPSMFLEVRRKIRSAEKTERKFRFPRKVVFVPSIVAVAVVLILTPLMLNDNIPPFGKRVDNPEVATMNVYLQEHTNLSSEQLLPQIVGSEYTVAQNGKMVRNESLPDELKLLLQYHYTGN